MGSAGITTGQLTGMRATATTALPDTCTITRPGAATFTAATRAYSRAAVAVYTGACRCRPAGGLGQQEDDEGDLPESVARYIVTVPWDAPDIRRNDTVTLTASDDSPLIGRPLAVAHVGRGTWLVSRQLIVEDREEP